ncbi:hypothetical protein CTAYLR_001416 [Chrysophaeum taylorii]|uniref:BZIP domain-containing protein n=1 Tax=Chrysophaeum taylorii TaxID=2483200 RepID=A0AAD7U8W5_9STRA|nr:hypothetical protein CTAYLR_001416 [Chrysophaeum taylorii]
MLKADAKTAENEEDDDEEKKQLDMKRKRNREHARLSRQRKRQKIEILQEDNDALRCANAILQEETTHLRERLAQAEREIHRLLAWFEHNTYYSGDARVAASAWR